MNILVITKRQYTNKDLLDDRYGRLRELPLELGRRGHQVSGLCLSYQPKPEIQIYDGTVRWQSCNASDFLILGIFKFLLKATRLSAKADIIIASSDSIFGVIGLLMARLHGIPLIFDLYDNYEYFLIARLPIIKQLYRYTLRKSTAITCVSDALARRAKAIRKTHGITVIENATNIDIFKPMGKKDCRRSLGLPEQGTFIGTAGAIHANRGSGTMFEAFDQLKITIPGLKLVLAGKWDRSIPKTNDKDIYYLGELPQERVPLLVNSLDVAIICNTDNEFGRYCFPQKAYEFLACRVPIVAAGVGSMAEMFRSSPEHLFTPKDSDSLVQSIKNCLSGAKQPNYRPQTWKEATDKMEEVIKRLCPGTA